MKPFFFILILPITLIFAASKTKLRKPANVETESSVLRKIELLEAQRVEKDPFLIKSAESPNLRISKKATLALGRIGDSNALEVFSKLLNQKRNSHRAEVVFALSLLNSDFPPKLMLQTLGMYNDNDLTNALLSNLGRIGKENLLAYYEPYAQDLKHRQKACLGLGFLFENNDEINVREDFLLKLLEYAKADTPAALAASFALSRYQGEISEKVADGFLKGYPKVPLLYSKLFLLRKFGKARSPQILEFLEKEISESPFLPIKVEIAFLLPFQEIKKGQEEFLLKTLSISPEPVYLTTLLNSFLGFGLSDPAIAKKIKEIYKTNSSLWVRGEALRTLSFLDPPFAEEEVAKLNPTDFPYPKGVVGSLAILGGQKNLNQLAQYFSYPQPRWAEEAIESLKLLSTHSLNPFRLIFEKALKRKDAGITAVATEAILQQGWKDFLPLLKDIYFELPSTSIESKSSILNAMEKWASTNEVTFLEKVNREPYSLLSLQAAKILKALTNRDYELISRKHNANPLYLPSQEQQTIALRSTYVMKTSKGEMKIRCLEDSPLGCSHFYDLVEKKFYDKKQFFNVLPNFIIQTGDERNDGFGTPAFLINDEISNVSQSRGTLSFSSYGRDAVGTQFFINLIPNFQLNARFTAFAEIYEGLELLDRIEPTDFINSLEVKKTNTAMKTKIFPTHDGITVARAPMLAKRTTKSLFRRPSFKRP